MKLSVLIFFFCLVFLTGSSVLAQPEITGYQLLNKTIKQYNKAEWDIKLKASYINPYDQKDITVRRGSTKR